MECVTISQTVKRKDFEIGDILWTKVQAFQDPNAHEVRGVVKLENDSWKMCLALISNPDNRELAWPAQLCWKLLFVVEGRKTEEIGQRVAKDWNEEDIGKIFWVDCIKVPHSKLEEHKLVDSDGPITFVWFVELAVAFSPSTTRETREAISEHSTEENVDTTDDERDSQEDESQGAGASQLRSITQGGADGKKSMPSASAKVEQREKGDGKEDKTQSSKYKGRISRLEQDNKLKDNIIKKLENDIEQSYKTWESLKVENERLRSERKLMKDIEQKDKTWVSLKNERLRSENMGKEASSFEMTTKVQYEQNYPVPALVDRDLLKLTVAEAKSFMLECEILVGNRPERPKDFAMFLIMPGKTVGEASLEKELDETRQMADYLDDIICCSLIKLKRI